jgi:hypothetical protein
LIGSPVAIKRAPVLNIGYWLAPAGRSLAAVAGADTGALF